MPNIRFTVSLLQRFSLVLALLLFTCVNALADERPTDELASLLEALTTLQGEFAQRQYDESGALLVESSGQFKLLRPGYFYWEIQAPDSQLVVADPQYVWHHDRDLETVTRRPANGSEDMAPLQILNADGAFLRASFDIDSALTESYTLTPKTSSFGFDRVTLMFSEGRIQSMEIADKLGQRVFVEFHSVIENPALGVDDFVFTPPPSADIFHYDE